MRGRSRAQRPRIPFRMVNRRDTPGHDPEMQRHHLLPRQLLTRPGLVVMLDALGHQRVGFDDFRANGLLLPAIEEAPCASVCRCTGDHIAITTPW